MVTIDDLPPAPRRQREAGDNQTLVQRAGLDLESESQFAAEIVAEEVGCHECLFIISGAKCSHWKLFFAAHDCLHRYRLSWHRSSKGQN